MGDSSEYWKEYLAEPFGQLYDITFNLRYSQRLPISLRQTFVLST